MKIITGDKLYIYELSACEVGHPVEIRMRYSTDIMLLMYTCIYIYINVKNDILSKMTNKYNRSISGKENEALKQLLDDDSLITRPSDKGSQIGIYDTEYYCKLVEHDLDNCKLYKKSE